MQTQWLPHVATALYDPVHANRHLTRNALFTLGFRDIEAMSGLDDLRRVLEMGQYDLCIADVTAEEERACALIRDLRLGKLGGNPFLVVLVTTWRQSGDLVRRVIESGADDLIVRPLSIGTLKTRIAQQIEARKNFVVTSTYIGPDRRRGSGRSEGDGLIEVPNSLKLKARDGVLSGLNQADLSEMRRRLERTRIEKCAFHIGLACRLISDHLHTPDESYDLNAELASLAETVTDLRQRCMAPDLSAVAPLCDGAETAMRELSAALRPGGGAERTAKPIALLTEISRAVQLALNSERDESTLTSAISETVERIRARRQVAAEGRSGPAGTEDQAAAG